MSSRGQKGCGANGPQGALSQEAEQHRRRAADLLRIAERTREEPQRRMLLALAAMYHRLAAQIEETGGSPPI
jgi:hypothetical protein